jgi:ATP-dependent Clp protease adaptor protein ClpS
MKTTTLDPKKELEDDIDVEENAKIILINDDHNSFDTVIDALIKYCKHSPTQAHQCAILVHNKGRYAVKEGEYLKLLPIKEALCDAGLLAEIE